MMITMITMIKGEANSMGYHFSLEDFMMRLMVLVLISRAILFC